jgi:hypothetical protein
MEGISDLRLFQLALICIRSKDEDLFLAGCDTL